MKKLVILFFITSVVSLASCERGKDEQACITGNCAGTRCFESVGSSCSTIHACEPISNGCTGDRFTAIDVEKIATNHANKLLNKKYITEAHVDEVKSLVRSILKDKVKNTTLTK